MAAYLTEVSECLELHFLADLLLERLYPDATEFDHLAALEAIKVIMVRMPQAMFVVGMSFPETHFSQKPPLHQNCESPIHCGPRYPQASRPQAFHYILCLKVPVTRKDLFENVAPFGSKTQPSAQKVLAKGLLSDQLFLCSFCHDDVFLPRPTPLT